MKGGRVAGLYFLIGAAVRVVCIAEGYATGASIHAATEYAVAVAFNSGNLGLVAGVIRAATCVVSWHLNEARRLLVDLDTPPSLAAAIQLDAWLRNEATANDTDRVQATRIYQYGPNCVRDSRDFRAALAILAERGRARMEQEARRRYVAINPALRENRE